MDWEQSLSNFSWPWCHVSVHEQTTSVTLWCAAISSSPSMHEQLKDFPPESIIMNCELIDCDKRLSHQPSSPDAEKTFHLTQVQSPWPRATSSEVGRVTSSVTFNTANQRSKFRLKSGGGGYGEFTLSRLQSWTGHRAYRWADGDFSVFMGRWVFFVFVFVLL